MSANLSQFFHRVGSASTAVTITTSPTSGSLLIAALGMVGFGGLDVNTSAWSILTVNSVDSGIGEWGALVYRYQPGSGFSRTLPSISSTDPTFYAAGIWEFTGVAGTRSQDIVQFSYVGTTTLADTISFTTPVMNVTADGQIGIFDLVCRNGGAAPANTSSAQWATNIRTYNAGTQYAHMMTSRVMSGVSSAVATGLAPASEKNWITGLIIGVGSGGIAPPSTGDAYRLFPKVNDIRIVPINLNRAFPIS